MREDYSPDGDAWSYLPHDAARSTAFRWNEEGMAGVCDDRQHICLALSLWNGVDPILKERMFGLTNAEGNHGEDVKERYFYLDATPTGSWLRWRYQYPVGPFPYDRLVEENARRTRLDPEFEIEDTDAFDGGCFDIEVRIAKAAPEDICWELVATNTSPEPRELHVLPTLWFRKTWGWDGAEADTAEIVPTIRPHPSRPGALLVEHLDLGDRTLAYQPDDPGAPVDALFCDNETNDAVRHGRPSTARYPKDGINDHVVGGRDTVNPARTGTKAALWHRLTIPAGETRSVRVRLGPAGAELDLGAGFDDVLAARRAEADEFHSQLLPPGTSAGDALIARQAIAGLVWSRCFYRLDVSRWIDGDPGQPPPPEGRGWIRNGSWRHLDARDVISMPDAWEYPWFAAWDLAFHCVALGSVDPAFAKQQLLLLTREWFAHPTGALPAYEWDFSDVNPPVQAWAAREVFLASGGEDFDFLKRMFHKLLLNFTWWVNRQDPGYDNVFAGGFLGMDNVGPFDRSHPAPLGGSLEQADGTAWMALYCLDMLEISLLLAVHDPVYQDVAVKFSEHFSLIADALDSLWDDEDGFLYDHLRLPSGQRVPLRVRSVAGLVAVAASRFVGPDLYAQIRTRLPEFTARFEWFLDHRPESAAARIHKESGAVLLAALNPERMERVIQRVADPEEFLSPFGLRSLSRYHRQHPYAATVDGVALGPVDYEPAESMSGLFGGNSNWRGPVWLPINFLVLRGLRQYRQYVADEPVLHDHAELTMRLDRLVDGVHSGLLDLLRPDGSGRRPAQGPRDWPEGALLFHEYFDGDTGEGLGASHQTGWTALLVDLILRPGAGA
ncbi:MAG: hypothetical protein JWN61_1665 [Pseudonocardiales bacterium]|nr:hypothetical protein [Pseudonocardiales bacterium]